MFLNFALGLAIFTCRTYANKWLNCMLPTKSRSAGVKVINMSRT